MIRELTAEELTDRLKDIFAGCADFSVRRMNADGTTVYLAVIDGFTGRDYITLSVIRPLLMPSAPFVPPESFEKRLAAKELTALEDIASAREKLLSGAAVVYCDVLCGVCAYACMARTDPGRSVAEPDDEIVVRGPREGFVESAEVNTALLRKRLRTERLKVVDLTVGDTAGTTVRVLYMEGVADEGLVRDVIDRIRRIRLPAVMDSGYIEQYLTPRGRLLTEVGNSEKPDKVAAKLTEGRAAIICDGSPVVLTVPYLFIESLQSAEDYLKTPYYATFIRCVRFVCMLIALYLPAFYIAVLRHHTGAVPYALYEKIVTSRINVPFGLFGELTVILLIFEIIREVGVRMPGAVGDAVSIVAGLVLGDAAIKAGISSAPVIMVASLTAICTFIMPPFMNAAVLVRFFNTLLARLFGMAGIALSLIVGLTALCTKRSFGVPYMYPLAPLDTSCLADTLLVLPRRAIRKTQRALDGASDGKEKI